jgi:membrane-associated phospholipid phosphatase
MTLGDIRVLLALNHLLAAHPALYTIALRVTDQWADLAFLATVAWLWFWRERSSAADPAGAASEPMTRADSRARLILLGAGAASAYVLARLLALHFDRARPFATCLPLHSVPGGFEGLREFGTFPSDHAALLGALPVGFAEWGGALASIWGVLAAILLVVRIAVGFHYPSDMMAGALLGMAAAAAAMAVCNMQGWPYRMANRLVVGFSRPPYAYVLYAALVLVGIEFAMHFTHVLGLILILKKLISG